MDDTAFLPHAAMFGHTSAKWVNDEASTEDQEPSIGGQKNWTGWLWRSPRDLGDQYYMFTSASLMLG